MVRSATSPSRGHARSRTRSSRSPGPSTSPRARVVQRQRARRATRRQAAGRRPPGDRAADRRTARQRLPVPDLGAPAGRGDVERARQLAGSAVWQPRLSQAGPMQLTASSTSTRWQTLIPTIIAVVAGVALLAVARPCRAVSVPSPTADPPGNGERLPHCRSGKRQRRAGRHRRQERCDARSM